MAVTDTQTQRVATITALVEKAQTPSFGRTALMKCLYLLQTIKGVPLDYDFQLYTYGPFDSDVLTDLGVAERLGAVKSELFQFSGGYGYELHTDQNAQEATKSAAEFLARYDRSLDEVISEFGRRPASDLEMVSTVVFVERAAQAQKKRLSLKELVKRVNDIKPHLNARAIQEEAKRLSDEGLISVSA